MAYTLKLKDDEMESFIGIFVDGIRLTEAARSAAEERAIAKVVDLATKYENDRMIRA